MALLASFRPCKRRRPISNLEEVSDLVQILVAAIEKDPTRRWKAADFKALSIDESTARRQFNTPYKVFGSQFQQQVWQALCAIPYGEIRSYKEQAVSLNKPNSYRTPIMSYLRTVNNHFNRRYF